MIDRLGDYEVVRPLGKGAMSTVYEVRHLQTGVLHAAKLLRCADQPIPRARFRREAELVARCDRHPHVVKVHSFGEAPDGRVFMILDRVDGEDLSVLLRREGRLDPRRATLLARDVAAALGFAHARGIVHRDVKPSNVLVGRDGSVLLTDFGVATAEGLEPLTQSQAFLGTPYYAAPEQARGPRVGPPADVYSAGALLYEALSGRPPHVAATVSELLTLLARGVPAPDVRTLAPRVPASLAAVVTKALAPDPELRFRDGAELARALDEALRSLPEATGAAPEPEPAPPSVRPRRRSGSRAALWIMGALVAAAGGVFVLEDHRGRAGLAASREVLEQARTTLAGARTADDVARARSLADDAIARAEEARGHGLEASAEFEAARRIRGDVVARQASLELARGAPLEALAALESAPPLSPPGELVRIRALAELGRPGALDSARALAASSGTPEAIEVLGDVLVRLGLFAEAEEVYARAAARVPPAAATTLHAKRAGAAALAGHDEVALGLARQLLADGGSLKPDRAANARFAPLAPAVYRRALLATDLAAKTRDLELAWRLGPPPPTQAAAVVRSLVEVVEAAQFTLSGKIVLWQSGAPDGEQGLAEVGRMWGLALRARAIDSAIDLRKRFVSLMGVIVTSLLWNTRNESLDRFVRIVWAEDPGDDPCLLLLRATMAARKKAHRESIELASRAVDAFYAPSADDPPEMRNIAAAIGRLLVAPDAGVPVDVERLARIVIRADDARSYRVLARELLARGDPSGARHALEASRVRHEPDGTIAYASDIAELDVEIALAEGDPERALAATRQGGPDDLSGLALETGLLAHFGRWEAVVAMAARVRQETRPGVPPAKVVELEARALIALHRYADAHASLAELAAMPGPPPALGGLERALAEAETAGRREASPGR